MPLPSKAGGDWNHATVATGVYFVYQGPNGGAGVLDTYNTIVSADQAKVISTSWGLCEDDQSPTTIEEEGTLFAEAATQGQTVLAAAGDTANQTLLLSDDATINTKPQLEIYADDVKCTHGATVGQLDAESLFYLRTRGVGLAEARSLLTYAFANDIVGRIKVPSVRAELERSLLQAHHLPAAETGEENV